MKKGIILFVSMVALTLVVSSCNTTSNDNNNNNSAPVLTDDQVLRQELSGIYISSCSTGSPSSQFELVMSYASDYSTIDFTRNIYASADCSAPAGVTIMIRTYVTTGAVTGETDQNFTASTTYLGGAVEVKKANFVYPNGTYATIHDVAFSGTLGVNTLDTETLVDSIAYPDTPSAGAKQYGVLYMSSPTVFLTNFQFEAAHFIAGPNHRLDEALDTDNVWTKQ